MSQARDLGDAANFLDNITADIQPQLTPAGTIITFGGSTAPTGYLACTGQEVLISSYPALYAAIGTTWGASLSPAAYFKLPDLRGAFLRGTGSNATHNMANGNDFAGQAVGSFEDDQFQGHLFGDVSSIYSSSATQAPLKIRDGNKRNKTVDVLSDNNHGAVDVQAGSFSDALIPIDDQTNGSPRTGDETRPFNASILYCIKT